MNTVPVLWVSFDDSVLNRGYADQGMLEAILDRSLWRPPGALAFDHREVRGDFPSVEGAVVVLPSRHHVEHIDWFCAQLDRLHWAVVLLTSEEEWVFDWRRVWDPADPHPRRRLWVWQPRPEHEDVPGKMPCGWYRGTPEAVALHAADAVAKPYPWFFGGQITHVRRQDCVGVLRQLPHEGEQLLETQGYFQGIDFADYIGREAKGKVVPCPSGPESLCTARVEEALEAGCVPVVDLIKPKDPQFDYWRLVFGADCPLRGVHEWRSFPSALEQELAVWPANANQLGAWWSQWKRQQALRLDDDVRAVSGLPYVLPTPSDLITVIVPTSPVPTHPSTADLEETIASVREQLPEAEIILAADAPRPEQDHRREAYEEYLRRVLILMQSRWHNVVLWRREEWGHQANVTRDALAMVRTPMVLFVEHDTPLCGPIEWEGICSFVQSGEANVVRFHFDVSIHPDHEPGMLDHGDVWKHRIPVRRTSTWWQRPHVALTRFYREVVMPYFPETSRTMIEDLMHGVVSTAILVNGEAAWWDWRLWVYTPDDPVLGMKRSRHLDSRGDDPKFEMWFS